MSVLCRRGGCVLRAGMLPGRANVAHASRPREHHTACGEYLEIIARYSDRPEMEAPRVLMTLATTAVLVLQPSAAQAECANPPDLEEALRRAPAAFVGEVTQAGLDSDETTVEVQWIWKGPDLPETLVLQTPSGSTTTGEAAFRFRAGTTYIVLLEDTTGPLAVGECSGTRRYRGGGEEIPSEFQLAAGATMGRAPGAPTNGDNSAGDIGWSYLAVASMLLVAALTLVVRAYLRKRRSRPASTRLKRRIPAVNGLLSSRRTSGNRRMQRLKGRNRK